MLHSGNTDEAGRMETCWLDLVVTIPPPSNRKEKADAERAGPRVLKGTVLLDALAASSPAATPAQVAAAAAAMPWRDSTTFTTRLVGYELQKRCVACTSDDSQLLTLLVCSCLLAAVWRRILHS